MLSRSSGTHHESGTTRGIIQWFTASSLCISSKEPRPNRTSGRRRGINISGVDFWHAVEFSRNGRFLCTHPRDSLRLSSGRFPSVLRFRLYQILSDPIPSRWDSRYRSGIRFSRVSLSGGSDFIRSSESEFPPLPGLDPGALGSWRFPFRRSRKRTGAGLPDANRGAPLQVHAASDQTSTTTGRIIGRRR